MRRGLFTVLLTGALLVGLTGIAQATVIAPNGKVAFPTTKAGTKSSMNFTLSREAGDADPYANNVSVDQDNTTGNAFTQTNTCPPFLTALTPSCTITVTFTASPRISQPFTYTTTLFGGDQSGDSQVALSARAVPAGGGGGKKCKKHKGKGKKGAAAAKKKCKKKK